MSNDEREIRRKLRALEHAEEHGNIRRTCRYFGVDPEDRGVGRLDQSPEVVSAADGLGTTAVVYPIIRYRRLRLGPNGRASRASSN